MTSVEENEARLLALTKKNSFFDATGYACFNDDDDDDQSTSNNQRLRSASDNDHGQKAFAPWLCFE